MKMITLYECSGCGKRYESHLDCGTCESRGVYDFKTKPKFKVGDLVECNTYGWHETPDSIWTREFLGQEDDRSTKHRGGRPVMFALRWVISSITVEDHTRRYHLWQAHGPSKIGSPRIVSTSRNHIEMTRITSTKLTKWTKEHNIWRSHTAIRGSLA